MRPFSLFILCTAAQSITSAEAFHGASASSRAKCPGRGRDVPISRDPFLNKNIRGDETGAVRPSSALPMSLLGSVGGPLIQSVSIFAAVNGLGALLSLVGKTQIHVDLLGTGSFALAMLPVLLAKGAAVTRIKLSAAAVTLWSIKLASFLLYRIIKTGHDARLTDLFKTFSGTISFWIFSLLWGLLCSLPHTLGTTTSSPGNPTALIAGTVLYAAGLMVETTADWQKWMFKSSNPGKFCNVGLWSISQHPNWFGNLLLWGGILVINAPALIDVQTDATFWQQIWGYRKLAMAAISPLFMWALFKGQADGSMTTTVELANAKYGADSGYIKYIEEVPMIIPKLF